MLSMARAQEGGTAAWPGCCGVVWLGMVVKTHSGVGEI